MEHKYIIDFQHVDIIQHNDTVVLADISLQVEHGEWIYLVGKVGSGKTSLIHTIHGRLPVRKGTARVAGINLVTAKTRHIEQLRRRMGVVFQDFQLLYDRSVYANLAFVLRATGWRSKKKMDERIYKALEKVELKRKSDSMPHQLSGGEQQRVAIARALLNNPDLIIADEPTGNLDTETSDDIMKILIEINRHEGPAVLMATHNLTLLKNYPARTLRCERGALTPLETDEEIDLDTLLA
ncbi:MAG: ATP-binding cassette domain-containing protein [Prevotellaceae bacterium]|jgi:cell division transport system ATP-binding protein|nr:ATP-binding cassette domain-containing protein [Prevotellaceae bacterium]